MRPDQVTLIANGLGVTEQDVVEMNRRLSGDFSLNAPLNEDQNSAEWQDRLVQEGFDQESHLAESEEYEARRTALGLALKVLDDRERHIVEARRLVDPRLTLERLAMKFRVSGERVRQIETSAFKKVQRAALAASAETAFTDSPTERPLGAHPRNSTTFRGGVPPASGRRISVRADLANADA